MVGIDADTGAQGVEVVGVHYHVGQRFAENIVLALIGGRKSIVLDMNRSVNKSAEATQNNLDSFPDVVLFGNTVSISYLCLLDCRSRNLDIIYTECGNIA